MYNPGIPTLKMEDAVTSFSPSPGYLRLAFMFHGGEGRSTLHKMGMNAGNAIPAFRKWRQEDQVHGHSCLRTKPGLHKILSQALKTKTKTKQIKSNVHKLILNTDGMQICTPAHVNHYNENWF